MLIGETGSKAGLAIVGHPHHRLAFVDPELGILLAEADGSVGQCCSSRASDASRAPPLPDSLDRCSDLSGYLRANRPAVATR